MVESVSPKTESNRNDRKQHYTVTVMGTRTDNYWYRSDRRLMDVDAGKISSLPLLEMKSPQNRLSEMGTIPLC